MSSFRLIERRKQRAFSLFELLIALFVFSVLSIFAFRSINLSSNVSVSLALESVRLSEINKVFSLLESDLRAAREVSFLDEGNQSGHSILIEKNSFDVFSFVQSSCIKYDFSGGYSLSRRSFLCVSSEEGVESGKVTLISDITDIMFSSISGEKDLVLGLKVALAGSDFGEVTRLFYVDLAERPPFILSEPFVLSGALESAGSQMEQLEVPAPDPAPDPALQLPPLNEPVQAPEPSVPEPSVPEPSVPEPIPVMVPLV